MHRLMLAAVLSLCSLPAMAAMVENRSTGQRQGQPTGSSSTTAPTRSSVRGWYGAELERHQSGRDREGAEDRRRRRVVLVADVYGSKIRPTTDEEAGKVALPLREDRATLRARAEKSVAVLKDRPERYPLDATRIGALGFCFGGTTALELVVAAKAGRRGEPARRTGDDCLRQVTVSARRCCTERRRRPRRHRRGHRRLREGNGCGRCRLAFVNFSGAVHCFAEPEANNPPGGA